MPADVAIQPDGKIVVGGYIINAENEPRQAFLVRYLPNGSLDESFADKGIRIMDYISDPRNFATLNAIALQQDGKILAAVTADKSYVYRFSADGSLDRSFGDDGEAYFQNGLGNITGFGTKELVIQEDGKIIAGGNGYTNSAVHTYMSIARLNRDGSIDNSFGQNGLQYVQFGVYDSQGKAVLLQQDGKIICSGNTYNSDVAVARFNEDGQLDSTFSINGQTLTDAEGATGVRSAVLQKDGKIVIGRYRQWF